MNFGAAIGAAVREEVRDKEKQWIAHAIGSWAVEYVREYVEHLDATFFERWETHDDEHACPACGQLNGEVFEKGEGFIPPVHDFCRCQRVYDHVEYATRYTVHWRAVPVYQVNYEWRQV